MLTKCFIKINLKKIKETLLAKVPMYPRAKELTVQKKKKRISSHFLKDKINKKKLHNLPEYHIQELRSHLKSINKGEEEKEWEKGKTKVWK